MSNKVIQTKKADIKFNEQTIQGYTKEGIPPPRGELFKKEMHDKFKAKFSEEKGKLRIIIRAMHRKPIRVVGKDGKTVTKDYLTYSTTYEGHDWLGNPIRVIDNIEGNYQKPTFQVTTKINTETGEYIQEKQQSGTETVYTIELTEKNRKKVIEDIINKSSSNPEDILYYYHVPQSSRGMSFRCSIYTYDQFINSSMEELENLARKTPSPVQHLVKDRKDYHG
jgi:hypothetical protein